MGGGAFSGKDPTKVDRSAAYICRQMAKSVVKSGLCKRALVQLSYAIGVAKPLSLFVETYGTEQGALTADDITNVIKIEFDCRPGAIGLSLALREPKYQETAAYCHFGRAPVTKNGIKFFEWENAKDVSKYKSMTSAQVTAALKSSNYLKVGGLGGLVHQPSLPGVLPDLAVAVHCSINPMRVFAQFCLKTASSSHQQFHDYLSQTQHNITLHSIHFFKKHRKLRLRSASPSGLVR